MKLKKAFITAMAITVITTTCVGAYAANPQLRGTVGNIIADIRTYSEGEMPAIPDGAVMFSKEVIEGEIDENLSIYVEGEIPDIPDSATRLETKVVAE